MISVRNISARVSCGRHGSCQTRGGLSELAGRYGKLAFFLPALSGGGAERAMLLVANSLAEAGHDVDMVLSRRDGPYLEKLSEKVRLISLDQRHVQNALPALNRYMCAERPDAIVTALFNSDAVLLAGKALMRWPSRVIISVQNTPSAVAKQHPSRKERLLARVLPWLLRFADGVVAISQGVGDDVAKSMGRRAPAIRVVHNPVVFPGFDELAAAPVEHPWFDEETPVIVAVGRLTRQKDYPTLFKALAKLRERKPARLLVLGDGEDRAALEALAGELGIRDAIDMPGFVDNPYAYLRRADLFVLSSLWEGFANVVAEALACGTNVVSTDCPHGPREILEGGRFGRLTPMDDPAAMAAAIEGALAAPLDTDTLRERGHAFSAERAASAYLEVLTGAVANK